jgi:hypothetical protein
MRIITIIYIDTFNRFNYNKSFIYFNFINVLNIYLKEIAFVLRL